MHQTVPPKRFLLPLDRVALLLMLILTVGIGLLILSGDRVAPKVREFSWQEKEIGAEDSAFVMVFSRPMDTASVETNLRIEPPLPGKVSWAGRRMAYTLTQPAPYGTRFQIQLQGARDRFANPNHPAVGLQPFNGSFRSRDRAFAYIGSQGPEEGRLILYNLTKLEKQVLTPESLVVLDFKPYPLSDRILFTAVDRANQNQGMVEQKLYTITTGILPQSPEPLGNARLPWDSLLPKQTPSPLPAGQLDLILDNQDYQNLKFDLAADGQTIVVQRVSRKNPGEFGPWLVRPGQPPQPLKTQQPGGDFLITPDGTSLAIAQGQGLAILPLQPQADPLDFLPKFGMVLSFARDGSAAAMLKFNTDYTRSLFLVTNQGIQKEILRTTGSVLDAQFDPTAQTLYCLLTNLVPGETYREQPYLAALDLVAARKGAPSSQTLRPLVLLPNQRGIQMSLAPDGLGLLFDQTNTVPVAGADGKVIADSRLWLLPLSAKVPARGTMVQPVSLPLSGLRPRWLP